MRTCGHGSSVTVGLAAIVFQYYLLLAAAIVFFMLVGLILSALGIDFQRHNRWRPNANDGTIRCTRVAESAFFH